MFVCLCVCVCVCFHQSKGRLFGDAIRFLNGQGHSNHEMAHARLISIRVAAPIPDERSLCGKDDDDTSVPLIAARKFRAVSPSSKVVGPALGC